MAQAKIYKLPDGDAFLEIGLDYIRIGVGKNTFLMLDKTSMSAGSNTVNWQMSPDKHTYFGLLTPIDPIAGFSPIGPKYSISTDLINQLTHILDTALIIQEATNIGI